MNIKGEERKAETFRNLADCLFFEERYRDAEEAYRLEISIEEKLAKHNPGKYGKDLATAHNCIGACLDKRGWNTRAEKEFLIALNITSTFEKDQYYRSKWLIRTIYYNLIGLYVSIDRLDEAIKYEFKVLKLIEDESEEHPNPWPTTSAKATTYWALSVCYEQIGFCRCSERMKTLEKRTNEEV